MLYAISFKLFYFFCFKQYALSFIILIFFVSISEHTAQSPKPKAQSPKPKAQSPKPKAQS
ncbi:hypothetical protein B4N84_05470 [Flavobacterium sp. IR1]|nr:hypothetical protein B4N84_05470 [Flavobacterium sp. IR1]